MSNALMSIELMTCIAAISLAPAAARAQDRPDCPGKIICPLTGDLVCKDRCPLGVNGAALTELCCAADAPAVSPGMVSLQDKDGPISLRDTLEPLIDHFNSGQGRPRFVALLSSTCPACVFGAEAVRDSVLNAYPDADIQVSIVWIDMLPSDNEKAAIKSSTIFDDPRVKQFYDPDRKSGYAIAKDLLYENAGPAWDIYLYYDKDAQWTDQPPKPIDWVHQLGGERRADPARFRPGQQLVKALRDATDTVIGGSTRTANLAVAPDKATSTVSSRINTTCPISGAPLTQDMPTFAYQGHDIGICCSGCDEGFLGWSQEKRDAYLLQNLKTVNDICPISRQPVGDSTSAALYNGFKVGTCCESCVDKFDRLSDREKDAFIGEFAQLYHAGCAVTGCIADGDQPSKVTFRGKLLRLCCQQCAGQWQFADDEQKLDWFNQHIAPAQDAVETVRTQSEPSLCCAPAPASGNAAASSQEVGPPAGAALRVEGMTCQACVDAVEKSLAGIAGVTEVGVNLENGLAWVGFDATDAVSEDVLIEAVKNAGFEASIIRNAIIQSGSAPSDSSTTGPAACAVPLTITPRRVGEVAQVQIQANPKLIPLDDSLQPVIDRFNADRNKPRIVALLSPTCGGCVHAARALQKEIVEAYPDKDLSLLIVWEPMLGSDDQPSAEKSSNIFNDPRVTQYWDGQRLSGITYSTQVYADRFHQLSKVTPEDHFLASMLKRAADASPEQIPMWDFALFYPAGVIWKDAPPKAQRFIRQLAYSPGQNGSGSTLLVDDFSKPPIQSDWFDEVRREMRSLMSEDVTDAQTIGVESGVNLQYLSFPSCPNTPELRQRLTKALAELGIDLEITEVNLLELAKDDPRLCYGAPTVLVNGVDLMGQSPSDQPALCCRIYVDGKLPSRQELVRRLQACYSAARDN
ncbi:MAG: cation transporter [Phycisphaerales bacterium]